MKTVSFSPRCLSWKQCTCECFCFLWQWVLICSQYVCDARIPTNYSLFLCGVCWKSYKCSYFSRLVCKRCADERLHAVHLSKAYTLIHTHHSARSVFGWCITNFLYHRLKYCAMVFYFTKKERNMCTNSIASKHVNIAGFSYCLMADFIFVFCFVLLPFFFLLSFDFLFSVNHHECIRRLIHLRQVIHMSCLYEI